MIRRIELGVHWFMDEWHIGQGDTKDTRRLKRKRGAIEGQATVKGGRMVGEEKRKEKPGGGQGGGGHWVGITPPRSGVVGSKML